VRGHLNNMEGLDNYLTNEPNTREQTTEWRNSIHLGNCLEIMKGISDNSIDMILADLPYGTTACKWDTIIPFDKLWEQYERIIKQNGAIVLTASQPFTSALVMSNPKMFKYELIWQKTRPSNVFNAKKQFMKWHENICIFYKNLPTYNPQTTIGKAYKKKHYIQDRSNGTLGKTGEKDGHISENNGIMQPKTVIEISNPNHNSLHPTQKPVELMEYLIKTFSNEEDIVLDNTMGSGTTCVACKQTNRIYIGIEQEEKYFKIAEQRLNEKLF
jgi:site-specific DNA-methyltransferase (adenine-specific)